MCPIVIHVCLPHVFTLYHRCPTRFPFLSDTESSSVYFTTTIIWIAPMIAGATIFASFFLTQIAAHDGIPPRSFGLLQWSLVPPSSPRSFWYTRRNPFTTSQIIWIAPMIACTTIVAPFFLIQIAAHDRIFGSVYHLPPVRSFGLLQWSLVLGSCVLFFSPNIYTLLICIDTMSLKILIPIWYHEFGPPTKGSCAHTLAFQSNVRFFLGMFDLTYYFSASSNFL